MNIYLVEIDAYDPDTSSVVTWRASTGQGFIDSATGNVYEPRLLKLPVFSRSIRSALLGGRSEVGYGEAQLANGDHSLDGMRSDYFDGRTFTLLYGDHTWPRASFATVMSCKIQTVVPEGETISVRLRDRSPELEKVFSTSTYGGTNALPLGVDGTADDIKGQYRPRIFGRIAHMSPVLVNTSKLIYECNSATVDDLVNVFDAGAYLTRGSAYSSQSDMETTAPSAGTWRYWISSTGAYIRLGSSPFGSITACVAEKWAHTQISAAGILTRIFSALSWSAGTDYVSADLTTLDQLCCGPLGIQVEAGETIASLIDRICQTVGAWWGWDSLSRFRVGRLEAPASPVTTLTDTVLRGMQGQASDDEIPWRIVIPADRNYAVQNKSNLAGIVQSNLARVAWFEAETRDQKAEDATVKTKHLTATEQTHTGAFAAISQAQAETTRRLSLLSSRRDGVTGTLEGWDSYSATLDLGTCVSVQSDQVGYATARDMVIVGTTIDYGENSADLEFWG